MPASYPGAIYAPRTKENKVGVSFDPAKITTLFAEDNIYNDQEIVAIENELGLNPKGVSVDVAARFGDIEGEIAGVGGDLYNHVNAFSAHGVAVLFKIAAENLNNSTTFQNDDELVISIQSSSFYYIEVVLFPYVRDVAGFKWRFTIPTMGVGEWAYGNNAPETPLINWTTAAYVLTGTDFYPCITMRGFLKTLQSAGNFQLQWAQQVSDADYIALLPGSFIRATKLE